MFDLESIDWGFARPKKMTDRILAYAQSEWMVEYLVERAGFDVIDKMLTAYRERKTQPEGFEAIVGVGTEQFIDDFEQWAAEQIASWGFANERLDRPATLAEALNKVKGEAQRALQVKLVESLLYFEQLDDAQTLSAELVAEHPDDLAVLNAHLQLQRVRLAMAEHETDAEAVLHAAVEHAETLSALQPDNPHAASILATKFLHDEQYDQAIVQLNRYKQSRPTDPSGYRGLVKMYLERGDNARALPELLTLARLDSDDVDLPVKIAEIYEARDQQGQAIYWLERAIHIDPYSQEIHEALGRLLMKASRCDDATAEYEVLAGLATGPLGWHHLVNLHHHRAGHADDAKKHAERAVTLDANHPAKTLLDGGR